VIITDDESEEAEEAIDFTQDSDKENSKGKNRPT
jgi:hypothetical protein